MAKRPPRILSIAGSDCSGGAGVQADVKTITMLGGYAMTAITAVTAQNSRGVQAIAPISADMVYKQIAACIDDIGVDAVKVGMLHDEEIMAAVSEAIDDIGVPIVLDPVMLSTSGAALIAPGASQMMREQLFPLATMLTPNLQELAHLIGRELNTTDEMAEAAFALAKETKTAVLAKGGHTKDARVIDILVQPDLPPVQFDHARIDTPHTHGTGCTLSSAIATLLAHGQTLEHAMRLSRNFVLRAIEAAPGYGEGNGPMGHQAVRSLD